jgi:hypothetical protein
MKLDYGTYLALDKYINLDEGIKELALELMEDEETRRLVEQLYWARKNLGTHIYHMVEMEEY